MSRFALKSIGQVLLWTGFVLGAFTTVRHLENEENPWRTIPWGPYSVGIVIGAIGVVLLRLERRRERTEIAEDAADIESLLQWLDQLAVLTSETRNALDDRTCEQILEWIDHRCVPLLMDFADNRMVIAHRLGHAAFAEVMTEFASGERYLNRAWSAAADGYVDEVERSIEHAATFFEEASVALKGMVERHAGVASS